MCTGGAKKNPSTYNILIGIWGLLNFLDAETFPILTTSFKSHSTDTCNRSQSDYIIFALSYIIFMLEDPQVCPFELDRALHGPLGV